MTRNSGEIDNNMGKSSQHIRWDRNFGQGIIGELPVLEGQNVVQEVKSPSTSRTTSSKRLFRQGFHYWVAFERNLSPNISDLKKRTCPVAECEECFGSELQMRQHLKGCLHLEKGIYRCHETDKIERIGKCETKGCRELQQYKSLFSNAMHTLGRRLSRGCRPGRLVNKISKKYSKPSHIFGVDPRIPYPESDWGSAMDNSDVPPEYTSFCSEWAQDHPIELSSDRDVVELSAPHGYAELHAGYAITPEHFGQSEPDIPELGVADGDSTQASQLLSHGTYQPTELFTATNSVFEHQKDNNVAQNVQADGWELTPSECDTAPENFPNMYYSNNSFSMTNAPTMSAPCQQTPQPSNVIRPYDCTELVSPLKEGDWNGTYPSTCNVSPIGMFRGSDVNQGNSVFSASPSPSASGTSVSSIDSIKTPDSTPAPFVNFFNQPDGSFPDLIKDFEALESTKNVMNSLQAYRVYQEPVKDEFYLHEAVPMSTNQSHPATFASQWSSGSSSNADQSFSSSSSYTSDTLHEEFQTQHQPQLTNKTEIPFQQPMPIPQHQIRRKPVASPSPENHSPVQQLSPGIDYSTKVVARARSSVRPTPHHCQYCPQRFTDKSNRKRHVTYSCKKRPNYTTNKEKKTLQMQLWELQIAFHSTLQPTCSSKEVL
ncbi:hypothetical protein G7Y89_g14802 [Cudoniella acicularis]|uniref:C2H2-type domain-containing protein n=1 Tax=Cudoniella acicularis TaxID=354080 RepID=A0A8H4QY99_9HELO|nr:hypothetical protein G7Y89_g14802 [Cudoniella acicularis]